MSTTRQVAGEPLTELDARYSVPSAVAVTWGTARELLAAAELYWLSTVRPDGRPHVTPVQAVWRRAALYFCTGPQERKARNLAARPECVLTTGRNSVRGGLDLVVEGVAERITADDVLRPLAEVYEAKYGSDWSFEVREGSFFHSHGGEALVFALAPVTAFGFAKGENSGQTRWRFAD